MNTCITLSESATTIMLYAMATIGVLALIASHYIDKETKRMRAARLARRSQR